MLPELGLVVSLILLILGSFGLPVGMPPAAEDPLLTKVAPAECLAYTSWAGTGPVNPGSTNSTEKLLADPETAKMKDFFSRALASAAKDAKPGTEANMGRFMAIAQQFAARPTAVFVESIAMGPDGMPQVKAAIVSRQETNGAALQAQFLELAKEAKLPSETSTLAANGRNYAVTTIKMPDGTKASWAIVANFFVLTQGEGTLQGVLTRVAQPAPAFIAEIERGLPAKRVVARSYVNLAGIKKALGGQLPPQADAMLTMIGLDQMQALYGASGLDDQGFVSRSWLVHTAAPGGLFRPLGTETLTAADLAAVPADATFALVMKADANQAIDALLELQGKLDPQGKQQVEMGLMQFKQITMLDARADVVGSLGTVWRIYSSPTDGAMVYPGLSLVIDLKDAAKMQAVLNKAVEMSKSPLAGPGPKIEVTKVGAVDTYTLAPLPPGMPIAPTWAISGGKLIVGASAIAVRNFIRRDASFTNLSTAPSVQRALVSGKTAALAYVNMKEILDTYGPLLPAGMQLAARQIPGAPDFGPLPAVEKLAVHMEPTVVAFSASDRTWEWTTRQTLPGQTLGQGVPLMLIGLLPAAQQARMAAQRMQGVNNVKQLTLAMHNYHSTYAKFPPAFKVDNNGKPLHSWRTLILPYVEQGNLHDKIKFDEPWNSPHNLKLFKGVRIDTFRTPGVNIPDDHTTYMAVKTKNSLLRDGTPRRIDDCRDGTANTVMIVEVDPSASVPWYQPDDWTPGDAKKPLATKDGLFTAGFADGSVRMLSNRLDKKLLDALFSIDGGEVIRPQDLEAPAPLPRR